MIRKITPEIVPERIPRRGPQWLSKLAQMGFEKRGWQARGEMVDSAKSLLAVAPHTSNWDFFIGLFVVFALKLDISFLGKHTIFKPPLGSLMRWLGGIPVERSRAHGLVEQVGDKIRQSSTVLLAIAPEGTRSPIYPWKTGFLRIAASAGIPVQLIGLDYQHKHVVFGPVIQPGGDVDQQMQTIYAFYATVTGKYPEHCITSEPEA